MNSSGTALTPPTMVAITAPCKFDLTGEIVDVPLYGELVVPGLAITPTLHDGALHGGFTLTHVASGRSVASVALCLNCARSVAGKVADQADWTAGMDDLVQNYWARQAARTIASAYQNCTGYLCDRYAEAVTAR